MDRILEAPFRLEALLAGSHGPLIFLCTNAAFCLVIGLALLFVGRRNHGLVQQLLLVLARPQGATLPITSGPNGNQYPSLRRGTFKHILIAFAGLLAISTMLIVRHSPAGQAGAITTAIVPGTAALPPAPGATRPITPTTFSPATVIPLTPAAAAVPTPLSAPVPIAIPSATRPQAAYALPADPTAGTKKTKKKRRKRKRRARAKTRRPSQRAKAAKDSFDDL